ncbi:MAG: hypothetical protein ACOH17_05330 [Cellulomonas sp.]
MRSTTGGMSHGRADLTSDPSAEHIADRTSSDDEARAADARAGGDASQAPRSLLGVELEPDDEAIASSEEWDDPERL